MRICLLFLILASGAVWAKTEVLVLGGGGEPNKETTIFDEALEAVGRFAKSDRNVNVTSYFDGGHRVTESIARTSFGRNQPFTAQNYNKVIETYERKILNGEIKDKLLIYLNTHGAIQSPGIEKTHGLATTGNIVTNFDSFSGPSVVSMDSLIRLTELAARKGVKLGIVDLSCHSGSAQALANASTCVISGTGPLHYAGAGSLSFGTLFSKEMRSGKSLEEIFLAARARFTDTSFPMISSPAGKDVQGHLYHPLTPYLYYYSPQSDQFTSYMEAISNCDQCKLEDGFHTLMDEADMVLRLTKDRRTEASIKKFKLAVKDYYHYLGNLESRMKDMGLDELNRTYKFCSHSTCVEYTVKQLMTINYPNLIKYYESQAAKSSGTEKRTNLAYASNARSAMAKRDSLVAQNVKLKEANKFWGSLPDLQRETSILQSQVAASQRELYEVLYQNSKARGPNPCREFVL